MSSFYKGNYSELNSVIDLRELKSLQDSFCQAVGVYAYCLDSVGMNITEPSGNPEDIAKFRQVVSDADIQNAFRGVSASSLEDQTLESTIVPNMKYGAVSVTYQGNAIITWIIFAALSDADEDGYDYHSVTDFTYLITEAQLNHALDLLREASCILLHTRLAASGILAETKRNRYSEEELLLSMRRKDVMTEIVSLLDSDERIEVIMQQILQKCGTQLGLSDCMICQLKKNQPSYMDVAAEWRAEGTESSFEEQREQIRPIYLQTEQLLAVSSHAEQIEQRYLEEMEQQGVKAMVVVPIRINGAISMYAVFREKRVERIWTVDELKFINDASRILQSIITRRVQKNSLAGSYASLEMVLDNIGSSVYVRERESGQIIFANRSLRQEFHKELLEDQLADIFEKDIAVGSSMGRKEIHYDIREQWYELYYTDVTWMNGKPALLCSIHEITEKKEYQQRIEQLAYTDFLTGLFNRMCCERDLAKFVDLAREAGREGALLYLDLDDFKHINDGLGHQYGDVLLQSIAHSLRRVVGIRDTCYRMGGDEFVIIIPPEKYHLFDEIVEGIKQIFNRPWFLKDADYYCTMSMGIVHYPSEGEDVQNLIKKSDIAMYEAKKSGKNRVAVYSNEIDSISSKRLDMEKCMRDGAKNHYHEFLVYYQPIMDIQKEGTPCVGAEALIRWNSPNLGFIPPLEFIPLAEYLGLIIPIGEHVLRTACEDCKHWNDAGHPDYKVNVNLSVIQLTQPDLADSIENIIHETGINPRNLTLEVTESLAINDMEKMKEVLDRIRSLGIRIALDDFGTGYSSLNHIREIPLDVIKVDQSFVKNLDHNTYEQAFIRMISDLAETLGKRICVEGIETEEQYRVLENMKVRMVQGYYFDKPMPKIDFERKYV